MLFNHVSLEFPVTIVVANIEADTGAEAVEIASHLVDHNALLPAFEREYSEHHPLGRVLSISSSQTPFSGAVSSFSEKQLSCTYEISETGDIYPAVNPSPAYLVNAARKAFVLLSQALEIVSDPSAREKIAEAISELQSTGITTIPDTVEDQLDDSQNTPVTPGEHPPVEAAPPSPHPLSEFQIAHSINALVPRDADHRVFAFASSIFVSSTTRTTLSQETVTGWEIGFGEISVHHDGNRVAAIGTWREFADQGIPYFDDPHDIDAIRTLMLEINGYQQFYVNKPHLPDRTTMELDFEAL